jgi:hypothetical protein
MDRVFCSGNLKKYSMGRSTGLRAKNWKSRFIKLTGKTLSIATSPDAAPKFEIPVNAMSVIFENPHSNLHPEAGVSNCIVIRLFDNGVFNLLLQAQNGEEKATWISGLRQATEGVKGVQFVS